MFGSFLDTDGPPASDPESETLPRRLGDGELLVEERGEEKGSNCVGRHADEGMSAGGEDNGEVNAQYWGSRRRGVVASTGRKGGRHNASLTCCFLGVM